MIAIYLPMSGWGYKNHFFRESHAKVWKYLVETVQLKLLT